ncbi:MAG: bifunctional methylenetetrahydrofolate dehydrogenase/methenyltetrahydrofolate cyclohydrolase FolD [Hyphomicrobiaceae bacterium]|nr:bifunctional methylenetetrahydrofolate dehydrogenase/methenyltetrahydrofolate cyclohydrolase FolD [Hyphomicrobiaceae bacterium]
MTEASIIDGKAYAERLRARIALKTADLRAATGIVPGLAVVLVGEDPASQVYVRTKSRQAEAAGIRAFDHKLPASVTDEHLLALIATLNADPTVHGILVQLPLPRQISADKVLRAVDPTKDVDGFHPTNVGYLATGQRDMAMVPCTPLGCLLLLEDRLGSLSGLDAVVIGRSNIVGKPMAQLLLQADATVTVVHSRTRAIAEHCRRADIVVAALGRPGFVKADWIKPGATVIDVGINRIVRADGTSGIVGDVDAGSVRAVAGAMTPVPGGVGPMTIACLLANTVTAAFRARGLEPPDWRKD